MDTPALWQKFAVGSPSPSILPPASLRGLSEGQRAASLLGTPIARQLVAYDALAILSHCKLTDLVGGFGKHNSIVCVQFWRLIWGGGEESCGTTSE